MYINNGRTVNLSMFDKPIKDWTYEEGMQALGYPVEDVDPEELLKEIGDLHNFQTNEMYNIERLLNSRCAFPETYSLWFTAFYREERQLYALYTIFRLKRLGRLTQDNIEGLKEIAKTSLFKPVWLKTNAFREDFELNGEENLIEKMKLVLRLKH